ncbi:putative bacteriocin export ABC transporter [Leuconostoc lactis]|uniref:putative bacteriocin export ABC transporter n=1 Tax=Leuconostoc lactis TaxID=1246 RepID=UPI0015F62BFE|nr:putative bacteriocin export ABC transporter [Leuconostoc lactis]MBA5813368.1 putative bacteriocin export ABC transporter [Leuconostoc lactis]
MPELIRLSNLTKKFGQKTIFSEFNLTVHEGEISAITGPSGVGKSTLLNIIGFIDRFDAGTCSFSGKTNISINSQKSQKIIRDDLSYLFQNFGLIESDTVADNLNIAIKYIKKSKSEKKQMIKNILVEVGLRGFENRHVYELSGGEQQRVAVARSLIKPGRLLLADEPTGSLDSGNRDDIMALLLKANELGKTIILVTHDPDVAKMATRQIVLNLD